MGTVKYTGPVASFHCPTNAEIRSLKVHFSPKQEGSGDPSPENIRPIVGWDGVVVHNDDGIVVPEEYQKIEYIESDGYQWINTNIIGAPNILVNCTIGFFSDRTVGNEGILGSRQSSSGGRMYLISFYGNEWELGIGDQDPIFNAGLKIARYKKISVTSEYANQTYSLTIDNSITRSGQFNYSGNEYPMYLFACNNFGSAARACPSRVYNMSIQQNAVLVRNFVPCRRKSDNKPGMYDTVTQTFFTNQGTGEFICGPDIGQTTNYEFGVLGKNKIDIGTTTFSNYKQYNLSNNPLPPSTYTISATVVSDDIDSDKSLILFRGQNSNGQMIIVESYSMSRNNIDSKTFTSTIPITEVTIYPSNNYVNSNGDSCTWTNVQLELGSTPTTYEPYDPNHTVYGGWVDLITGEVCEEWVKKKISDIITLYQTNWGGRFRAELTNKQGTLSTFDSLPISSSYKSSTNNNLDLIIVGYNGGVDTTGYIYIKDSNYSDVQTFIAARGNEEIAYPLATPITYSLAPTQLQTFLGQNNVWSNADYVEVEYDLHETQTLLQRKAFIMANQPHIESASGAIASFNTDVRAQLKECKAYFSPVQDLHGYSNPWPAGGGKNIAKPYDNSYVSSSYVSFDYSAANGTFRCYGTASPSSTHSSPSATNAANNGATFTLPAGTYTLSIIDGDGANIYAQCVSSTETVLAETTSYTTFTTNESLTVFVRLKVAAAATVDNTVKIQLETGSSATAYVPYENVCQISGWTGCNIFKAGKNLLDPTKKYQASITQVCIGQNTGRSHYEIFLKAGTYIITTTTTIGASVYIARTSLGATSKIIGNTNKSLTFELDTDDWCEFFIYKSNTGITTDQVTSFQLEVGSIASNDSTYSGVTIPVDWTTEAGTIYGGYVDLVKGELVETYHKITLNGTSTNCKVNGDYSNNTYVAGGIVYLSPSGKDDYGFGTSKLFCDTMPIITANTTAPTLPFIRTINAGMQYLRLYLAYTADHPELDTAQKRKDFCNAWLAENNVDIVYPLSTPITHALTPTQLKSLVGTNNLWSSADGNIDLKYYKH